MTDQNFNQNQEGQKTIVAFVVGLLIGGLVVWMFVGSPAEAPEKVETDDTEESNEVDQEDEIESSDSEEDSNATNNDEENDEVTLETGDGSVSVSNQPAGSEVSLDAVTYPITEGWIGVRDYNGDRLGNLLGVVRFSQSEGLVPEKVILQRATTAGNKYAIVFYHPSESNDFNLATNAQVDEVFATFTAE